MATAERVSPAEISDNYVFQRNLFAYHKAAPLIQGYVLEIGTGTGYGVELIAHHAQRLITVDKTDPPVDFGKLPNTEFRKLNAPDFSMFGDSVFDTIISFQVIEHIENDVLFVNEIRRMLKPGGRFIVTTPNRRMSLTRNPWHVREYTCSGLKQLLGGVFTEIKPQGIYGNARVMNYYEENKRRIARWLKFDVLQLNRWMPRGLLCPVYDLLNRINRRQLLRTHPLLTKHIRATDFSLKAASDDCLDLFYVAA
ncbi:MAG: class I SAM-dependent methyltransferase [Bacteroidia bacterium]|jgi:SAM-dependent methyltransferase|nr:class I SAM-dependent methyltransferase [Bacteroidia bacterium]